MLRFLGAVFRSEKLWNASSKLLAERCGVRLGPKGKTLLAEECKTVSSQAGNSCDVGARVLAAMVQDATVYGLDADAQLKLARWSERLALDAVLPDTKPRSLRALARAQRAVEQAGGFGQWHR